MRNKIKYAISDACILCQNCKTNCPTNAITLSKKDFKYEIADDLCIQCGLCYRNCVYRAINKESK